MYKIVNRKKLIATAVADALGHVVFWPARLFREPRTIEPESIRRLLIIRTAYIGDVVMTLPILKPIRTRFPRAQISFLTSSAAAPLLADSPYVDEVLTYDPFWFYASKKADYIRFIRKLRLTRFDLVLDARGDIRNLLFLVFPLKSTHRVSSDIGGGRYLLTDVVPYEGVTHRVDYHMSMARFLGCDPAEADGKVSLTSADQARADAVLKEHGVTGPFIGVHPGSRLALKTWPADRCAELYDQLAERHGKPVVLFGTDGERATVDAILGRMQRPVVCLVGKITLRELAALLVRAAVFVCNDSAPMHIAAAMGTPTVALFGPSKSRETGPYGPGHKVVEKDFPCRLTCDENTCRHPDHNACIRNITVDDVMQAVDGTL